MISIIYVISIRFGYIFKETGKKNGNGEKLEALELSETLNLLKNLHKLMNWWEKIKQNFKKFEIFEKFEKFKMFENFEKF